MSREDDEIDYRMMYPVSGRTRKRSDNPRKPRPKPERYGFFSSNESRREPPSIPAKDRSSKAHKPQKPIGKSYEDAPPRKSMLRRTKEQLCVHPEVELADLVELLEAEGYEASPTTIGMIRREFMDTIKVAASIGYIRILD
jgi:hypothetical protein